MNRFFKPIFSVFVLVLCRSDVKSAGAAARKYLDNPFDPGKDQLENGRKQSYIENPH